VRELPGCGRRGADRCAHPAGQPPVQRAPHRQLLPGRSHHREGLRSGPRWRRLQRRRRLRQRGARLPCRRDRARCDGHRAGPGMHAGGQRGRRLVVQVIQRVPGGVRLRRGGDVPALLLLGQHGVRTGAARRRRGRVLRHPGDDAGDGRRDPRLHAHPPARRLHAARSDRVPGDGDVLGGPRRRLDELRGHRRRDGGTALRQGPLRGVAGMPRDAGRAHLLPAVRDVDVGGVLDDAAVHGGIAAVSGSERRHLPVAYASVRDG